MKRFNKLLLCTLMLTGCTFKNPSSSVAPTLAPELEQYSEINYTAGFDTFLQLITYSSSQEEFDSLMQQAVDLFTLYDHYFDIYDLAEGINNLKTINDQAGIAPVEVAPEIIECLLQAKEFYELSNHEFDITLGAVLQVWHAYREEGIALNNEGEYGKVPSQQELEAAAACTGWQYVEIDEENNTVYITNPCVSLDVGGIAKGFTAEKIAEKIEARLSAGIINAGGNNRTMKTKPNGSDWISGIQNPNGNGSLLAVAVSGSQSIVTSGDYQRYYFGEDGIRYHHIIDPKTNFPADLYRSVTIITQNSGDADALSTTLYTLNLEEGRKVLQQYNELHPDTPASAVWIMDQDQAAEDINGFTVDEFYVTCSDDLKDKIQQLN